MANRDKPRAGEDNERTQAEVLDAKDEATTTDERGLQQWGQGDRGTGGQHGEASEGTSERAARITEGQLKAERERKKT